MIRLNEFDVQIYTLALERVAMQNSENWQKTQKKFLTKMTSHTEKMEASVGQAQMKCRFTQPSI